MREININYQGKRDPIVIVESSCADLKLVVGSKGTVKSYPGCIHWHYKNPQQSGTLEITYWPKKNRLWLKIHSGRRAQWIDDCLPMLIQKLQS